MVGQGGGGEGAGKRIAQNGADAIVGSDEGEPLAVGAGEEIALGETLGGDVDHLFLQQVGGHNASLVGSDRPGPYRQGQQ